MNSELTEDVRLLQAASTMNASLLIALFMHHPKRADVLNSFVQESERVVALALASPASEAEQSLVEEAQELWKKTLMGLLGVVTQTGPAA